MTLKGDLESVHGELSELADAAGHIVREGALAEDCQTEEVNVALANSRSVPGTPRSVVSSPGSFCHSRTLPRDDEA